MRWWLVKRRKIVQKTCKGIIGNEKLLHRTHSFCYTKRRKGRKEVAEKEVKKSQTLTSPSTSHSRVLSSIAAALYDDDNSASERSERAKLDMPASRIGWCILPLLESGMSSLIK